MDLVSRFTLRLAYLLATETWILHHNLHPTKQKQEITALTACSAMETSAMSGVTVVIEADGPEGFSWSSHVQTGSTHYGKGSSHFRKPDPSGRSRQQTQKRKLDESVGVCECLARRSPGLKLRKRESQCIRASVLSSHFIYLRGCGVLSTEQAPKRRADGRWGDVEDELVEAQVNNYIKIVNQRSTEYMSAVQSAHNVLTWRKV